MEPLTFLCAPNKHHTHLSKNQKTPLCATIAKFGGGTAQIDKKGYLCSKCVTLSHKLGLSISKEEKISMRLRGNLNGKHNRTLAVNTHIFEDIDTAEKAYWFGFLLADGWTTDTGQLGLKLAMKDILHLKKFRAFIQAEHEIKKAKDGKSCRLVIQSVDLVWPLKEKGIVPRKSKIVAFPKWMRCDLIRHFIRGVFDGDGWICHSDRLGLVFGIVGSKTLLYDLQKCLAISCMLNLTKLLIDKRHSSGIVSVVYGGNRQCAKIYNYLYSDATVYLPRKESVWRKASHIKSLVNS